MQHQPIGVLYVDATRQFGKDTLLPYLANTPIDLETATELPDDLSPYDAVVIVNPFYLSDAALKSVQQFVAAGGGCLGISRQVALSSAAVALFGAQPHDPGPSAEVRVLFTKRNHPLGVRLPDAFYVSGDFLPLDVRADDVETVLYADWRYTHRPILTQRAIGDGLVALTTIQHLDQPVFQRILYRLLRRLGGAPYPTRALGVGLLGYAPSVGQLHGQGAAATPGLALRMACDLSTERLDAAQAAFPGLRVTRDSAEMRNDPTIDLVIIATPPNTHAKLALDMLAGGKHVICEKPLALTTAETDAMLAAAAENGLHLSCHQNRRWDGDYRAIRRALDDGLIGQPFYMETFVGGYAHPCGFWHSHDAVSGGTTFDWGAHYLDWMLDLMPDTITGVIGTRQNRAWHDITNADQERIQLRFADGSEAEFTHSDLAFEPKPKWYVLGDQGSIVGHWRSETAYEVDPVLYYHEHEIPASEMGAILTLKRRDRHGQIITQNVPLPPRLNYPFHHNLADHLLLGEPIAVPAEHSARVVAVLEAAKRSAENGSRIESVEI